MRIGVLTGGGDCPGLNAVIRAIVRKATLDEDTEVFGFYDAWDGVMEQRGITLDDASVRGISTNATAIVRHAAQAMMKPIMHDVRIADITPATKVSRVRERVIADSPRAPITPMAAASVASGSSRKLSFNRLRMAHYNHS